MNLNVNTHRKTYFNIYQNENENLSSSEIERTVKNEINDRENMKKRSTQIRIANSASVLFVLLKKAIFSTLLIMSSSKSHFCSKSSFDLTFVMPYLLALDSIAVTIKIMLQPRIKHNRKKQKYFNPDCIV